MRQRSSTPRVPPIPVSPTPAGPTTDAERSTGCPARARRSSRRRGRWPRRVASSYAPSTWVTRQGSRRIHRTPRDPSPPARHARRSSLRPRAPTRRAPRGATVIAAASRVVGDSMNTTCSAVTPMSCCQVARSNSTDCADRSAPAASHSPMRRKMPVAVIVATAVASTAPVVDPEEDPPAVGGQAVHVGGDRDGQAAGELLGLQKPRVLRGDPGLGQGEHRSARARTHRHRPRTPGARYETACRPGAPRHAAAPAARRPSPLASRTRRASPATAAAPPTPAAGADPHGHAGPTRNRVPCRSGGSEPDIGRGERSVGPRSPASPRPRHDMPTENR